MSWLLKLGLIPAKFAAGYIPSDKRKKWTATASLLFAVNPIAWLMTIIPGLSFLFFSMLYYNSGVLGGILQGRLLPSGIAAFLTNVVVWFLIFYFGSNLVLRWMGAPR